MRPADIMSRARLGASFLLLSAFLVQAPLAAAEDSVAVRSTDEPYPERRVFYVTNSGAYVRLGSGLGGGRMRVILDGGAMVDLSPKNAVGGSWFIAGDEAGLSTGPVLRWRRRLGPTQSLDFAVGTPIASDGSVRPGSLLGLVKYNPVHWFGVAARPELVRHSDYNDAAGQRQVSGTKARLYLGAELGGKPGRVVGTVAVVLLLVGLAALAADPI